MCNLLMGGIENTIALNRLKTYNLILRFKNNLFNHIYIIKPAIDTHLLQKRYVMNEWHLSEINIHSV